VQYPQPHSEADGEWWQTEKWSLHTYPENTQFTSDVRWKDEVDNEKWSVDKDGTVSRGITFHEASIWIQPDGPGGEMYKLGCTTIEWDDQGTGV
jgi:hypothetical protein